MISFPWDNKSDIEQDRNVGSSVLADYFHNLNNRKSGIFAPLGTNGQIAATGNKVLTIQAVRGAIRGVMFDSAQNGGAITLDMGDSNPLMPRYDLVVIRQDVPNRLIEVVKKEGVAATTPIYPGLERGADVYEVAIAAVYRPAGSSNISTGQVSDLRLDESYVEIIPVLGTIDTSDADAQLKALIEQYNEIIKAALDETLAGQLQNQIDELKNGGITSGMLSDQVKRYLFDIQRPVGSVYTDVLGSFNPNTADDWYGTWVAHAEGRVQAGVMHSGVGDADDPYFNIGAEFGSREQELRALIGAINDNTGSIGYDGASAVPGVTYRPGLGVVGTTPTSPTLSPNHSTSVVQADGQTPSTAQPTVVVKMWKRIA